MTKPSFWNPNQNRLQVNNSRIKQEKQIKPHNSNQTPKSKTEDKTRTNPEEDEQNPINTRTRRLEEAIPFGFRALHRHREKTEEKKANVSQLWSVWV